MKMSFEEYYDYLRKQGDTNCSCHIAPPCTDCIELSDRYEEYLKEEEE